MTYNPISVSQLNKYIKDKFEEDEYFANVLVEGEISNFKIIIQVICTLH